MLTFREYREKQDADDFNIRFTELCECLVASEMSFKEFWNRYAIPVISKNHSEELILSELLDFLKLGQKPYFTPNPSPDFHDFMHHVNSPVDQHRKSVEQTVGQVKNDFADAMRQFINTIRQKDDPHQLHVAKTLLHKVMQSTGAI